MHFIYYCLLLGLLKQWKSFKLVLNVQKVTIKIQ